MSALLNPSSEQSLCIDDDFIALQNAVYAVLSALLAPTRKNRPSSGILRSMATQLALVMSGIRAAYLVDNLSVGRDVLDRLLRRLQKQTPPSSIAALWEAGTEQAFFVNIELFCSRCANKDYPLWVSMTAPYAMVSEPPSFAPLLSQIALKPGQVCDIHAEDPLHMIPFAGFLLEYPAAYVPESASHAALFDISLDVYEYNLIMTDKSVPLIKFSIPASSGAQRDHSHWLSRFEQRLDGHTNLGTPTLAHTRRSFERIAL